MKTVLSIAGSDSSGGAGIQADIKTLTMNGVYAMTAVTALTAQNTIGVYDILESSPEFLKKEIDAVFEDIPPDAVKIGMVSSPCLIEVIAERLVYYNAKNIVTDTVMVSTSGKPLLKPEAVDIMKEKLLPLSDVITPNIPEAEILSGVAIKNKYDMEKAAAFMADKFNTAVLLKGGHNCDNANDLLYSNGKTKWFIEDRIDNENTHRTGCTLSSAIAANLAKGYNLEDSVFMAKKYISQAIGSMLNIGHGKGPLNHAFYLTGYFAERN